MSQTQVITLPKNMVKKMKQHYTNYLNNKKIPYAEFSAKIKGTTITGYTSGKIVFQGPQAHKEAKLWEDSCIKSTTNARTQNNQKQLPKNLSHLSVLGSDEVGNGSYFGPVTVCATYVDKTIIPQLQKIGVRDSKELTDPQIIQLSKTIKELIPYKSLILEPKKYNHIQPKYNAVHMKVALHNQAIYLLLKEIAPTVPEAILIDQFTPESNFKKYVRNEKNQIKETLYFVTKGEQYHVSVAAASIISRAAFLEELAKESKELGFTVPSGAGTASDKVAAKILSLGGIELLTNYAKLHFANTDKAMRLMNNNTIKS